MRILVAYGSKLGGTEGLAQRVAEGLVRSGHQVELRRAREVRDVRPFDAVVIGGALYAFLWRWEARRFVTLNADELRTKPVWFFSSGPLDASASERELPPTRQVAGLMADVGARGHATFGGRLDPNAKGFMASGLIRSGHVGDFRDFEQVDRWVASIDEALGGLSPIPAPLPPPGLRRWLARSVIALCLFVGITAIAGGLELLRYADGAAWLPPLTVLAGTPFDSFGVPGALLLAFVGVPNLVAALALLVRRRWSAWGTAFAGSAITTWIVVELLLLRAPSLVEGLYVCAGLATIGLTIWLAAVRHRLLTVARAGSHSPAAA